MKFGKDHAPFGMMRMGERIKAGGKQVPLANFVRRHAGKLVPACSGRQFGADAFLQRLGAVHLRRRRRMVGQIVPLGEQVELPLHHRRLLGLHLDFTWLNVSVITTGAKLLGGASAAETAR